MAQMQIQRIFPQERSQQRRVTDIDICASESAQSCIILCTHKPGASASQVCEGEVNKGLNKCIINYFHYQNKESLKLNIIITATTTFFFIISISGLLGNSYSFFLKGLHLLRYHILRLDT